MNLKPTSLSSFLGQELALNTFLGRLHDKGDLWKDHFYSANSAHSFWLGWMKAYLPSQQGRNKWRTFQPRGNWYSSGMLKIFRIRVLIIWGVFIVFAFKLGLEKKYSATLQWQSRPGTELKITLTPKIGFVLRNLFKFVPV